MPDNGETNPWEQAAAAATPSDREQPVDVEPIPPSLTLKNTLLFLHALDFVVASATLIVLLVLPFAPGGWCRWTLVTWSILLIGRSLLALLARAWYPVGQLSLYYSLAYAITAAVTGFGFRSQTLKCILSTLHLYEIAPRYPHAVWIFLLALSIAESARWALVHQWRRELAEDAELRELIEQQQRGITRPWWWKSGSGRRTSVNLEDPLLNTNNEPRRRRFHWPWSSNNAGASDDASVEYASLNEDWATRSQDDPFWWSREEGGGLPAGSSSNNGPSSSDMPSWASGEYNGGEAV